jgi:hypothetical protein
MKIKPKLLKLIKNCVNFSLEDGERDKNDIVKEVMCNLWESGDVEELYEKELFDEGGEIDLKKDSELYDLIKVKVEELVN